MVVNQFTLELIQMPSKTSQVEENGDIRIFSDFNLSKIFAVKTFLLSLWNLTCGLKFLVAGQMLCSQAFPSHSEWGPLQGPGGLCDLL